MSDRPPLDIIFPPTVGEVGRRIAWEEDVKVLYGASALVTGIPGPHARRRMTAVAADERLARDISGHRAGVPLPDLLRSLSSRS